MILHCCLRRGKLGTATECESKDSADRVGQTYSDRGSDRVMKLDWRENTTDSLLRLVVLLRRRVSYSTIVTSVLEAWALLIRDDPVVVMRKVATFAATVSTASPSFFSR